MIDVMDFERGYLRRPSSTSRAARLAGAEEGAERVIRALLAREWSASTWSESKDRREVRPAKAEVDER